VWQVLAIFNFSAMEGKCDSFSKGDISTMILGQVQQVKESTR
jgi:hypothetical protein